MMIDLFLLVTAPVVDVGAAHAPLGLPAPSDQANAVSSAVNAHRALRQTIGEPTPQAATMVMLHGKGGHLVTDEYSIIVARTIDGYGTARPSDAAGSG